MRNAPSNNHNAPAFNPLPLDTVHPEYATLTREEHRTRAYGKLEEWVKRGTANASAIIERVLNNVPEDRIVRAAALDYQPEAGGVVMVQPDGLRQTVHRHALGQLAAKVGIPLTYVDNLQDAARTGWGPDLLAHNLRELHRHADPETRYLTRSVDGKVMAFLSDKYRRLDSRPILDAVLGAAQEAGGRVVDGIASDTKLSLRFIRPDVVEPVPGEYAVLGFTFNNSDFGDGALQMSAFLMRLICINGAVREVAMRKVHLGARLDLDIKFSERTYQLDTDAMASASKDLAKHLLSEVKLDELTQEIRSAAGRQIDAGRELVSLRAGNKLSKAEADEVAKTFNSPDVEVVPPGMTAWRFSNALSFLARNTSEAGRRMELERLAGDALGKEVAQAA